MNFLSDLFNRITGKKREDEQARMPQRLAAPQPQAPTPAPTPVTRMGDVASRETPQVKQNPVSLAAQLEKVNTKAAPKAKKPNGVLNAVTQFAEAGNQFLGHLGGGLINDTAATIETAHKLGQYTPGGMLNKAVNGDQPDLKLPRISIASSGNDTIDKFGGAGDLTKEAVELIPVVKAGTVASKAAQGTKLVKAMSTGSKAAQYGAKALPILADAAASGGTQVAMNQAKKGTLDGIEDDLVQNIGIGAAAGLGLPIVGRGLQKVLGPTVSKIASRFGGSQADELANLTDNVINQADEVADEVAPGIKSVNPNRAADAAAVEAAAAQKAEQEALATLAQQTDNLAPKAAAVAEQAPTQAPAQLPVPNAPLAPVLNQAPLPAPASVLPDQLPVQQSFIPELNQGAALQQVDELGNPTAQVIDPTAPVDPSMLAPNASQVAPSLTPEEQLLVSPPPANLIDEGLPPVVDETLPVAGADELLPQDVVPVSAAPEPMVQAKSPLTGEDIALNKEGLAREVAGLEAIPASRRTAQQEARLQQLRGEFQNFDENAVDAVNPTTADRFPALAEEDAKAVDEVMAALDDASKATEDVGKLRTSERRQRIMDAETAYADAGGGASGMAAKMRALKGEYSKSEFDPLKITDESQKAIYDDIEGSSLRGFEKVNVQRAFSKMFGAIDEKPVASDVRYIRDYYNSKATGLGDVVAEQLEKAVKEADKGMTVKGVIEQVLGAPRTMMTTFDLSAMRQAGMLMAGHPVKGGKAFVDGAKHAFSSKKFAERAKQMAEATDANGANYSDFMSKVMNLQMPNLAGVNPEEAMSSAKGLSKVPVYGRMVKATDRAFSSTLGEIRYNVAKSWIDAAGGVDEVTKKFSQQELEDMGEVINSLSGRGGRKDGFSDKYSNVLSKTLFSPRLWESRLNAINPYWYYRLSPPARAEALKSVASFATMAGGVLALAEQIPGVEVGTDPRSADFAKIKYGNTRYDIMGGLQQNIRVAAQLATGEKINSNTGELGEVSRADAALGFAEGKLNPVLGFGLTLARSLDAEDNDNPLIRKDQYNQEFNAGKEAGKLALPLGITGIAETAADTGSIPRALAMNAPAFLGAGVQTYGNQKTQDAEDFTKGKDINALRKQLKDNKIPLTEDGITDLAAAKDWDNAVLASEYRVGDLELDKKATKVSVTNAKANLEKYKFAQKNGFLPSDTDAIKARAESGEYDKAIEAMEFNIKDIRGDKNTAPSTLKKSEDAITKLKVARDNKIGPNLIKQYDEINQSEWRSMGDPESEDYNPEIYQTLWDLDNALANKGVSRNADHPDETFFSAKKGKGGGKGGGGGAKGNTIGSAIDLGKVSLGKIAGKQTGIAPVPVVKKLRAGDLKKRRKISVSKA